MSITSTVPGAIQALKGYLTTVAAANPDPQGVAPGVYISGVPTATVRDYYLEIGNWETGAIIAPETYRWNAIPGTAKLRSEAYAVELTIRTWAGAADENAALARIDDAFALLNGVHQQILNDLGGGGQLSPSGSWGDLDVEMVANGPLGGKGWGVILSCQLHVINAQLQG